MKRRGLAILTPVSVGLLIAALLALNPLANLIVALRFGLDILAITVGLILSLFVAVGVAVRGRIAWAQRQGSAQAVALAEADRHRLLQRLDHELKNPLTAIGAGIANLAEAPSQATRQAALKSVTDQVRRLSRLTADLRKLAELETRPLERGQVDLTALLQEVMSAIGERPEAAERRLSLRVPQAPWPLPMVSGDGDMLFLALHNLVDNALKFTQPDQTIEVRAFEQGTNVVVEVADTGRGIPDEEAPFVWEELARGQAARAIPGTGLGLALVRAVITRHDGQVALRSRVGQGTVVTVMLPTT